MSPDLEERLVLAFEKLASASEQSLLVSKAALLVQGQMAETSKALEEALGRAS